MHTWNVIRRMRTVGLAALLAAMLAVGAMASAQPAHAAPAHTMSVNPGPGPQLIVPPPGSCSWSLWGASTQWGPTGDPAHPNNDLAMTLKIYKLVNGSSYCGQVYDAACATAYDGTYDWGFHYDLLWYANGGYVGTTGWHWALNSGKETGVLYVNQEYCISSPAYSVASGGYATAEGYWVDANGDTMGHFAFAVAV